MQKGTSKNLKGFVLGIIIATMLMSTAVGTQVEDTIYDRLDEQVYTYGCGNSKTEVTEIPEEFSRDNDIETSGVSVYAEETDMSIISKISTLHPDYEVSNNLGQTIEIYELDHNSSRTFGYTKDGEPKIIMFNKDTGDSLEVYEGILDLEGYKIPNK